VLGAAVGFFAGLLGVGGGGIMVPMLTTFFIAQGFPQAQVVHMALGTSMAAIVLTSVSSLRAHHAHGAVRWDIVRLITPGILVGTFAATFVAARVSTVPLAIFFAVFMAYVSIQMLLNIKPKPSRELPGVLGMSAAGLGIGGVSALVAIGGGSLSVPFMTWCNVKMQNAIGTSGGDRTRRSRSPAPWAISSTAGARPTCRRSPSAMYTCRRWCWSPWSAPSSPPSARSSPTACRWRR